MTSTNTALTIPVFDPLGAVRALVYGWVLPALGRGLAFAASPFARPVVREIEGLLHARSDAAIEALCRKIERRNRLRLLVLFAASVPLASVGGPAYVQDLLTRAGPDFPKFWGWWESEREKCAAPPEVLSQMDVAVYSACRSLGRLFPLLASGAAVPGIGLSGGARVVTATEVFVAAMIGCLLVGRGGPRAPRPEAVEALVRRAVADVDDLSRFVAGLEQ